MNFSKRLKTFETLDFAAFFASLTEDSIRFALSKPSINEEDFLCLLSPQAENYLEEMAQKAHNIALNQFGRTVVLYTPMYLANYCVNSCTYCGYNSSNQIKRKKLSLEEAKKEALAIRNQGFRHIILLTGESRKHSPVSYIKDCIYLIKNYFSSISLEVYPLEQEEYRELIEAGADGLTIYQEVYNKDIYKTVHPKGPKSNYPYRLEAAERAAKAGIHSVSIGALLGLSHWRQEAFFTGLHGQYLQDNYPAVELTLSTPRIRPHKGTNTKIYLVTEKNLVQAMLAYKIFLPRAGINITTRESAEFRDNLIPLGVTKMSAAVSTQVGGHSSGDKSTSQFDIADGRTVEEIRCAVRQKGYNPIFKDWEPF